MKFNQPNEVTQRIFYIEDPRKVILQLLCTIS